MNLNNQHIFKPHLSRPNIKFQKNKSYYKKTYDLYNSEFFSELQQHYITTPIVI